ncbi:hypothetical protein [Flavobacterium sp. N2820]|uniref:hypothetical protein n=1 Tax=Flavobacterium sp. N2820 TaxID=2986834 RepID=UPI0022250BD2|nr:hypothetical protein [Flavobacterium sp. N2820]
MKTINFDYTGGFPLEQPVLKRMQSGTLLVLEAFVKHLGCADTGNFIISGCTISGANITPGIMYIDGELCPFAGAVGTATTKIQKQTNTVTAPFENGTNPPVFIETIAVVNAAGTELQNFTRFYFVQDANYVHTDNNFTAVLLAKLNSIASGAEVNVQTNWNETNPLSDAFLVGKPTGDLMTYLWRGRVIIGNIGSGTEIPISFPDVGTTQYSVLGVLNGSNSNLGLDNDVTYVIGQQTATSFKISFDEYENHNQQLTFSYFIIPNP